MPPAPYGPCNSNTATALTTLAHHAASRIRRVRRSDHPDGQQANRNSRPPASTARRDVTQHAEGPERGGQGGIAVRARAAIGEREDVGRPDAEHERAMDRMRVGRDHTPRDGVHAVAQAGRYRQHDVVRCTGDDAGRLAAPSYAGRVDQGHAVGGRDDGFG